MANAKSDIKLLDDFDGQVKVEAPDFCVDGGPGRRKGKGGKYRRALVHDNDGLTMNWHDPTTGNDYTGGVTINGVKQITAQGGFYGLSAITIEGSFLNFKGAVMNLMCQPKEVGAVKILGDVQFDGGILFNPNPPSEAPQVVSVVGAHVEVDSMLPTYPGGQPASPPPPPPPPPPPLKLSDVIRELQQKVAALEKAGQAKWRYCKKCKGLWFAGTTEKSVCPDGGEHVMEGSGNYRLVQYQNV